MSKERLATEGRSRLFWRACSQVLSLCAELYYQVPCLMHCRRGPAFICVFRKVIHRQSEEVPTLYPQAFLSETPRIRFQNKQTNSSIDLPTPSFLPSFLPPTRAPKSVPRISHSLLHTAISISNKTTSHLHRSTPQQTTLVKNTDVSIYQLQYVKAPPCVFRRGGGDG